MSFPPTEPNNIHVWCVYRVSVRRGEGEYMIYPPQSCVINEFMLLNTS